VSGRWQGTVSRGWLALSRLLRGVCGMPDYQRYLAHMQRCHPDTQPLSEHQFHRHAVDRRYGGARASCC
jgi:uncharacterized short protein YbdD (DUF466 family)